jgi:prepilin-type N-terminal cleavage/methylation domain-containing protein
MQKILKNPVNHAVCETVDQKEILNRVQNDSYGDLAVCHLRKLDDTKKSFDRVQNGDEAVAANDNQSVETLTRISNFRRAQIEILPSHKERGVFARLFCTSQGKEILNQVQNDSCGDLADCHPRETVDQKEILSQVQNDSYADLADCHSCEMDDMKKSKTSRKKAAFTLAEVLIAIGIIGVVAALTIPTISNNLRAKKLQSQFNKAFSDLNQLTRLVYQDTGMTFRENEIEVRSKNNTGSVSTPMAKFFFKYLKGYQHTNLSPYNYDKFRGLTNLTLGGEETTAYLCDRSNVFLDNAGRFFSLDDNTLNNICVDINGADRPNKWGVDRFIFYVTETNSVIPYTGASGGWGSLPLTPVTDEKKIENNCKSTSYAACSYFALKNKSPEGKGDYWHDFLNGK